MPSEADRQRTVHSGSYLTTTDDFGKTDRHRHHLSNSLQKGFTLIELMVVVVIVAILFSYTTLAIRTDSSEDIIRQEAQRIERLIELALEESILRGEEYGIEFGLNSYRFLRFDENRWSPPTDKLLRERELPLDMEVELRLEETEVVIDFSSKSMTEFSIDAQDEEDKQKIKPQVFLLSSGEISPEFDVRFTMRGTDTSYLVKGNFDGSVSHEISEF